MPNSKWNEYEKLRDELISLYYIWYAEETEIPPEVEKYVEYLEKRIEELEKDPEIQKILKEREKKLRKAMEKMVETYKNIAEKCGKTTKTPLDYMACILYNMKRQKQTS